MGGSLYGNQDQYTLLAKTAKDVTMAMEILDVGCILKNTRHKGTEIEDCLTYVPGVLIIDDLYDGKSFAKIITSGADASDFTFTDVVDAVVSTSSTSDEVTYGWAREAQLATFTQTTDDDSGAYSVNGGDYVLITTQPTTTLIYGDTVKVKLTSDPSASTASNVTLTMADATEATYDVTTAA